MRAPPVESHGPPPAGGESARVRAYALRRALGLLPVLFAAVVLTFVANQFVPGDPIMTLLSDQSGDAALAARLRAEYGLDRPLWRSSARTSPASFVATSACRSASPARR